MLRLQLSKRMLKEVCGNSYFSGLCFTRRALSDAKTSEEDLDTFELLPPGCSMVDPTYGLKEAEATVVFYDEKTSNEATNMGTKGDHKKNGSEQGKKPAASSGKDAEESNADDYVYLPPGCSLKDPGYNSTSDPDQRVHFVDPKPAKRNN